MFNKFQEIMGIIRWILKKILLIITSPIWIIPAILIAMVMVAWDELRGKNARLH